MCKYAPVLSSNTTIWLDFRLCQDHSLQTQRPAWHHVLLYSTVQHARSPVLPTMLYTRICTGIINPQKKPESENKPRGSSWTDVKVLANGNPLALPFLIYVDQSTRAVSKVHRTPTGLMCQWALSCGPCPPLPSMAQPFLTPPRCSGLGRTLKGESWEINED